MFGWNKSRTVKQGKTEDGSQTVRDKQIIESALFDGTEIRLLLAPALDFLHLSETNPPKKKTRSGFMRSALTWIGVEGEKLAREISRSHISQGP